MEPGWLPQRRMGVLLAEERVKDARQAELQASSSALEQGRPTHQGDCWAFESRSGGRGHC